MNDTTLNNSENLLYGQIKEILTSARIRAAVRRELSRTHYLVQAADRKTVTNLSYMRQFYLAFPIRHALRDKLSWTFPIRDALRHELSWTHDALSYRQLNRSCNFNQ
jgi:hypothetical protein